MTEVILGIVGTMIAMLLAIIGFFIKDAFSSFKVSIKEIATSLNDLNIKLAVIIQRVDQHEARLDRLEEED